MNMTKQNKWICGAIPALFIHICIGSVYCWSLLKDSIATEMNVQTEAIEFAFTLAIFFLGMSAAFGGRLVEKNVTGSSGLSTACFVGGLIGSVLMISYGSVLGFYLTYGVLMGIGLGIGYLSPVKTLMLWFKDNPGLATGLAIMGFGLSKTVFSPFIVWCNDAYGVKMTLGLMAIISLVLMSVATWLIQKPAGWIEAGTGLGLRGSIKTITNPKYLKIWTVFFLNITCGLVVISFEKGMSLSFGVSAGIIGLVAAGSAVSNALGRFGYATLSDRLKNKVKIYHIIFLSCIIGLTLFEVSGSGLIWWIILLTIINLGYGGGFSTLPVLLKDIFGMKNISTLHGFCLSGWAWAAVGAYLITQVFIYNLGYTYDQVLIILGILYIIAFSISWTIRK